MISVFFFANGHKKKELQNLVTRFGKTPTEISKI